MKGVIFNLVEEVVSDRFGEDTWDKLLDEAGLDGAYTSLGSYPDDQLFALVGAASKQLGVEADAVVRLLGQEAIPLLADRYPMFFEPHSTTRAFLLTLNDIIHPEVRRLYPGADVPTFGYNNDDDGALVITYHSPRKLCALAEGFILGAGKHYGEQVEVEQPACMHHGAPECVLRCIVSPGSASATGDAG
jgi:hypothetical protein